MTDSNNNSENSYLGQTDIEKLEKALEGCDYKEYDMIETLRRIARSDTGKFIDFLEHNPDWILKPERLAFNNNGDIEGYTRKLTSWLHGPINDLHLDNKIKLEINEHKTECLKRNSSITR